MPPNRSDNYLISGWERRFPNRRTPEKQPNESETGDSTSPPKPMAISNNSLLSICLLLPFLASLHAQSKPRRVTPLLEQETLQQGLLHHLLGEYLVSRSPKLPPVPAHAEEWTAQANDIRRKLLQDVVYRGWPREWVEAPLRFHEVGPPQQHRGYRLQKLLIQIVPGLQISALLYEPAGDRHPCRRSST